MIDWASNSSITSSTNSLILNILKLGGLLVVAAILEFNGLTYFIVRNS